MEHKGTRAAAIRENTAAFLKKQGFYVVLGLCILCIGIAAAVALLPGNSGPAEPTPMEQAAGVSEDERLQEAVRPTPAATALPAPTAAPTPAPTARATPAPSKKPAAKAAPPVQGEVIWGYAADTLLYSETLEQWTTHEGVDLKAKTGAEVMAIRGGTVTRVFEDNALGFCVEVEHEGGLVSLYGNLMKEPPVAEGERLDAGDTVGYVGGTAVSECGMEPHVHFALYKDGKSVDPAAYVLLGS